MENFEDFLAWLDPNREAAGRKYEQIRTRLIKLLINRRCGSAAEDLADECIRRVARKPAEFFNNYEGDPAAYFVRVADYVSQEHHRKPSTSNNPLPDPPAPPPEPEPDELEEERMACLRKCMEELSLQNRQLIRDYYGDEKKAKIDRRKAMASRLGIALNALRIRAFRIRSALEKCVLTCMKKHEPERV